MRIMLTLLHPAHVHKFKHLVTRLTAEGHQVKTVVIDKEITQHLLKAYGMDYQLVGRNRKGLLRKIVELLKIEARMIKIAREFNADIFVGGGEPSTAHTAFLLRKPYLAFDDTEHAGLIISAYKPFTKEIITPECFQKDFGKKQIRYKGYHELAYLHPNHFTPDASQLAELGIDKDEKYVIVRFIAMNATHDMGELSLSMEQKRELVNRLAKKATVYISSEHPLPEDLEPYKVRFPAEKIHHALAFASLFVGESATMASECAMLGTPAIYASSQERGYTREQQEKYQLVHIFDKSFDQVPDKALELLETKNLREIYKNRRDTMLKEKIDVTAFMDWFIKDYPHSGQIMRDNPAYQDRFI